MKIREFKIDDYPIVRDLWQAAGLILRPGDELEDVKLKLQRDSDLLFLDNRYSTLILVRQPVRNGGPENSSANDSHIPGFQRRQEAPQMESCSLCIFGLCITFQKQTKPTF